MRSGWLTAIVSILLNGCTTWTLTKRVEKNLDGNCTRMLRAIINKSWKQHPTKQQLYGHLPPITKTIRIRRTRHAGHCWRSKDELISDVVPWTPSHRRTSVRRLVRTYLQQPYTDTGCSLEDLLEAMDDRDGWWEREREREMLYNCGGIFFILSIFVLYILSFGLVRLRTFRLSAWVS